MQSEPSEGAQFHFILPLKRSQSKIDMANPAPAELLHGVKVLVVDDSLTNQRILLAMLQHWHMQPFAVDGGAEALQALQAARDSGAPFQLILTDMHMPNMDGFDLVAHIHKQPSLSAATIMMLTSAGHFGDAERCRQLGVAAYLLKPIRQSELHEAIARVLGSREQSAAPLVTHFVVQGAAEAVESLAILVAEDNAVNQRLAVRLLQKRGHRVIVASNGQEALDALSRNSFDLVLMDVQMPQMDGLTATAIQRKRELQSGGATHVTIIALTAHAMKGDQDRCLAAGMDGYLTKPIRPQELDDVLAHQANAHNRPSSSKPVPEPAPR